MSLQFSLSGADSAEKTKLYDVIIIGSGPAGLSAALYASRAHLETLVITGNEIGGQVATTWEVDNYPGFPEGLTGPELVERMQKQAERFGAAIEMDVVSEVDLSKRPFTLTGYNGEYKTRALIITTGASPRRLGVPGEERLIGRGVSFCATCDGWFFEGKEVVVIGGGDSALEEALFLTKYASKVTIIHRRDELRAGPGMQKRAFANEKIAFIWDTVVEEVLGEKIVEALKLRNVKTGEISEFTTSGVFVFIGHTPNTKLFQGMLDMDDHGYIQTNMRLHTTIEGVWVAGEAGDPHHRQVITSAGMGAAAAIGAQRWLDSLDE